VLTTRSLFVPPTDQGMTRKASSVMATDRVVLVTGHVALSFAQWAREHADDFR
jgi:hypothetical protein